MFSTVNILIYWLYWERQAQLGKATHGAHPVRVAIFHIGVYANALHCAAQQLLQPKAVGKGIIKSI
jgi:hypothetical protein